MPDIFNPEAMEAVQRMVKDCPGWKILDAYARDQIEAAKSFIVAMEHADNDKMRGEIRAYDKLLKRVDQCVKYDPEKGK